MGGTAPIHFPFVLVTGNVAYCNQTKNRGQIPTGTSLFGVGAQKGSDFDISAPIQSTPFCGVPYNPTYVPAEAEPSTELSIHLQLTPP